MDSRLRSSRWAAAWLTALVLVSACAAALYLVAQQVGRISADDVPRAMTHRAAQLLARGAGPDAVVGNGRSDLADDPTPFTIVFDSTHHVVATSAVLSGAVPFVPPGVLDVAADKGEDHVSWQPIAGVREAVVARPWRSQHGAGVVVAGVSLAPAEARARSLLQDVAIGWLAAMVAVTACIAYLARRPPSSAA
jgi:hypothetical protein